jgi:hypothetical protein
MVEIAGRARRRGPGRGRTPDGERQAFDDHGTWLGIVTGGGAVFDADGVQIGVEWPGGEVVDFRGARIGHL